MITGHAWKNHQTQRETGDGRRREFYRRPQPSEIPPLPQAPRHRPHADKKSLVSQRRIVLSLDPASRCEWTICYSEICLSSPSRHYINQRELPVKEVMCTIIEDNVIWCMRCLFCKGILSFRYWSIAVAWKDKCRRRTGIITVCLLPK